MAKITIDKKIVKFAVAKDDADKKSTPAPAEREDNVIRMHEKLERPEMLVGSTYKVKTPVSDHAMYVTINDIVLKALSADVAQRYQRASDLLTDLLAGTTVSRRPVSPERTIASQTSEARYPSSKSAPNGTTACSPATAPRKWCSS